MISEDSEALVCLSGLDEIKEKLEDTLKQAAQPEKFVSREAALESDEKTEAASLTENESQNQMQISSSDWKEQLREAVSKDKRTDSVIKFLGENPGACPWDEAKKYFSKSLMSISSEYNRSNSIKGTFN